MELNTHDGIKHVVTLLYEIDRVNFNLWIK